MAPEKDAVPYARGIRPWDRRLPPPPPAPEPALRRPRPPRRAIPVCAPVLRGNELRYVTRCVRSGWISSLGPMVREFERAFARLQGRREAVACSSGTAALQLALAGLGVGAGDEVVVPAFAMAAVAAVILHLGARPVLVDCDPVSWNMDPEQVERRAGRRVKAVLAVHTYGRPAPLDRLARLCRARGWTLVEDAAEAHGASVRGRLVGNWGAAAAFSLYANKVVTTGEGGVVVADDPALAERLRSLRDHGFSRGRHFWHRVLGYNYRMTGLQAAVGLAQLERFDQLLEARRRNSRLYRAALAGVPGLVPQGDAAGSRSSDWVFGVVVEPPAPIGRDELRAGLAARGIETRSFFTPLHLQPVHRARFGRERHPVAEALGARGLYLPCSSALTAPEIERVAARVRGLLAGRT